MNSRMMLIADMFKANVGIRDYEAIVRPPSVAPSPRHFFFPLLRTVFGEGEARSARVKV